MPDPERSNTEFYVGYLPMPRGYWQLLVVGVPILVAASCLIAVAVSARQKDPGSGQWSDATTTLEGVAIEEPYAILRVPSSNTSGVETVLLVEEGKFGAKQRIRAFNRQAVSVKGTILERAGRRMLELVAGEQAITHAEWPTAKLDGMSQLPSQPLGKATLSGEIIDPKCYLGAMKPGEGKTHKACATLCISGGIPPMFVTAGVNGEKQFLLLTTADGRAINDAVLPFVGDPVEITGEVVRTGDLAVLQINPADIRRL